MYQLGYIATNDDPKEPNKCSSGLPIEFDLERPAESNLTMSSIHQNEYIADQEKSNVELELRLSIGTTPVGSKRCSSTKLLGIGEFGSCRAKKKTGTEYGETHSIYRDSDVFPGNIRRRHLLQDGNLDRRLR